MINRNNAPLSLYTGVPGWEDNSEQAALSLLAGFVPKNGNIVEIGAEFGMSTSLFLRYSHETVTVFSVDLFPGSLMDDHNYNLRMAGLSVGRNKEIKGDSHEIGTKWNTPINLLFIDGDHSYKGVKLDIALWVPYVVPGGVVVFHDSLPHTNTHPHMDGIHAEVDRAISEWYYPCAANSSVLCPFYELVSVGTMRIFRRRS